MIKPGQLRTVKIEDTQQPSILDQWNYDLRTRRCIASDMSRKRVYIRNDDSLPALRPPQHSRDRQVQLPGERVSRRFATPASPCAEISAGAEISCTQPVWPAGLVGNPTTVLIHRIRSDRAARNP
jgi:hypothetical protein